MGEVLAMSMLKGISALVIALPVLAGCGTTSGDDVSIYGQIAQAAAPQIARVTGRGATKAPAAAPLSAEQMAARALASNPAPLIYVGLESAGTAQVMAMTGSNGAMRTYMTTNEQALIIRDGMLVGTKGLGNDLAVAEADGPSALIRGRRAGEASRTMRLLDGEGVERPLPMRCTVSAGGNKSFGFAGTSWSATQMAETCVAGPLKVENSYLVTSGGQIPVSRQWVTPQLGYVSIQTIRP